MTLLLIILTCAFTAFTLFMTLAPFLDSRDAQLRFEILDEELREIERLVAKKASLLGALRDIEYDWQTDKISVEDYERFKKSCERQAVGVMRRLDAIHGGRHWDETIDSEVAKRLAAAQTTAQPEPEQVVEDSTISCPECGKVLEAQAQFCSKCGTAIEIDSDVHPATTGLRSEITG